MVFKIKIPFDLHMIYFVLALLIQNFFMSFFSADQTHEYYG